jgi:pimeloyl-ACP methyl ester carboxylesterase
VAATAAATSSNSTTRPWSDRFFGVPVTLITLLAFREGRVRMCTSKIGMDQFVKKQLGRRGFIILGLAAIAAVSFSVSRLVFGRKRLRFPYLGASLPESEYQALAAQAGWSTSQVVVAPGISLNGLVRRPKSPAAPWVLFYQGNDAHMLRVGQAFLTGLAADRDWGLAIYAYRGYDSSSGGARLPDLAADAPEILAQLCATEHVERSRVHVVGFSIGGHLAVRAMVVAARLTPKPASLTLLAPVDDIVMVPRSFYERFDSGDDFQTQPFLGGIPAPVLVIQGTADEALLGPEQGRAIAATLGDRARYVELPGVGHTALLSNKTVFTTISDFISGHSTKTLVDT